LEGHSFVTLNYHSRVGKLNSEVTRA